MFSQGLALNNTISAFLVFNAFFSVLFKVYLKQVEAHQIMPALSFTWAECLQFIINSCLHIEQFLVFKFQNSLFGDISASVVHFPVRG